MDPAQKELWSITEDLKSRGYTIQDIEEIMCIPQGIVNAYLTGDWHIPSYALILFRALQQFPVFIDKTNSEALKIPDIDIKALSHNVSDYFKTDSQSVTVMPCVEGP